VSLISNSILRNIFNFSLSTDEVKESKSKLGESVFSVKNEAIKKPKGLKLKRIIKTLQKDRTNKKDKKEEKIDHLINKVALSSINNDNLAGILEIADKNPVNATAILTKIADENPVSAAAILTRMAPVNATAILTRMAPVNVTAILIEMADKNPVSAAAILIEIAGSNPEEAAGILIEIADKNPVNATAILTKIADENPVSAAAILTRMAPVNATAILTKIADENPVSAAAILTRMAPVNATAILTKIADENPVSAAAILTRVAPVHAAGILIKIADKNPINAAAILIKIADKNPINAAAILTKIAGSNPEEAANIFKDITDKSIEHAAAILNLISYKVTIAILKLIPSQKLDDISKCININYRKAQPFATFTTIASKVEYEALPRKEKEHKSNRFPNADKILSVVYEYKNKHLGNRAPSKSSWEQVFGQNDPAFDCIGPDLKRPIGHGICSGISFSWVLDFINCIPSATDPDGYEDNFNRKLRFDAGKIKWLNDTFKNDNDKLLSILVNPNNRNDTGLTSGIDPNIDMDPKVTLSKLFKFDQSLVKSDSKTKYPFDKNLIPSEPGKWAAYVSVWGHAIAIGGDPMLSTFYINEPNTGLLVYRNEKSFLEDLDNYTQYRAEKKDAKKGPTYRFFKSSR
jgi:flagellar motility protein MotE (MotC chaperone)